MLKKRISLLLLGVILGSSITLGIRLTHELTKLKKENIALYEELEVINTYFREKYRINAITYVLHKGEEK